MAFSADIFGQSGEYSQENNELQIHSAPCEIYTPDITLEPSIPEIRITQDSFPHFELAQNMLSCSEANEIPIQHQEIEQSASPKRGRKTANTREKSRNRNAFRSRKSRSRGSSKNRSRSKSAVKSSSSRRGRRG